MEVVVELAEFLLGLSMGVAIGLWGRRELIRHNW